MTTLIEPVSATTGYPRRHGVPGFDKSHPCALRVGVQLSVTGCHPAAVDAKQSVDETWFGLTPQAGMLGREIDAAERVVRIQAADLRDASRKAASVRADAAAQGGAPVSVLVDIEVILGHDARAARQTLDRLDGALRAPRTPTSLLYVGTSSGLVGLIADIFSLRIADGVMLLPLSGPGVLEKITEEVFPRLELGGFERQSGPVSRCRGPARQVETPT